MPNSYFQFKQFRIEQARSGMKVTTDACLFGALVADHELGHSSRRILDIGSGTGLLTLMLAQKIAGEIVSVEANQKAFDEGKANFDQSPWSDQITPINGLIQEFDCSEKFDLIISNPPFFHNLPKGDSPEKNQALHASTLSSSELARSIDKHLSDNGRAWIMYPPNEMKVFRDEMKTAHFFPQATMLIKNHQESVVIREIVKFSRIKSDDRTTEIAIFEEGRQYSDDFNRLLKDYYLYIG